MFHLNVCAPCMCLFSDGGQKRTSLPPELKLQIVVSHQVQSGN